jgi:hypothetical protein
MQHGDLVRVFYSDGQNRSQGPFHGIVCMTPDDHPDAVWQMWCIERNTYHILQPNKDRIEVVSEA